MRVPKSIARRVAVTAVLALLLVPAGLPEVFGTPEGLGRFGEISTRVLLFVGILWCQLQILQTLARGKTEEPPDGEG